MPVVSKPKRGEKAGFIRQHPDLKASEVVEAAKKQGLKLTTTLVYNVRASSKGKKGKKSKAKVRTMGFEVGNGHHLKAAVEFARVTGGLQNAKAILLTLESLQIGR
jgi:hypothetical protein